MKNKGFAPVIILIIIGILVVAGGAYYFGTKSAPATPAPTTATNTLPEAAAPNPTSASPEITITSPKAGEVWQIGKTYSISWTGNFSNLANGQQITWSLSKGDGGQVTGIGSNLNTPLPLTGSNDWTIPGNYPNSGITLQPGNDYKMEVALINVDEVGRVTTIASSSVAFSIVSGTSTAMVFKDRPAKVVAVSAGGKTVSLDFLTRNPNFLPGQTPFFLNETVKVEDYFMTSATKGFECNNTVPNTPASPTKMISDLAAGPSRTAYFDISGNSIETIYQQCLP